MRIYKRIIVLLMAVLLTAPVPAQDLTAEVPPPSDDAAVWYLTASLMVGLDDKSNDIAQDFSEVELAQAGPVIDRLDDILYYAREGAKRETCSWAVDLSLGPATLLPHLAKLRILTRILAVSAQVRLERGDPDGAIEDWLTIMRMAPHAATDGTLVSCLVQLSIDRVAVETLANRMGVMDRDTLVLLQQGLAGLNDRQTISRTINAERIFVTWLKQEYQAEGAKGIDAAWIDGLMLSDEQIPAEIKALDGSDQADRLFMSWIDEMGLFHDRLVELAKLPIAEFEVQAADLDRDVSNSANPLVRLLMPHIGKARWQELRTQSLRAMLDAMIAYRLGGEQAFQQVVDPYDGEPFDFEVADAGVVLRSRQIQDDDQPVSLIFPAEVAQPLD